MTSTRPKRVTDVSTGSTRGDVVSPTPGTSPPAVPAASSSAVRSSGRDRKPVKEFQGGAATSPMSSAEPSDASAAFHHLAPPAAPAKRAASRKRDSSSPSPPSPSSPPLSPSSPPPGPRAEHSTKWKRYPKRPQEWNAEGEETFCVCHQPYDVRRFYIACDWCEGWYHAKCVNVSRAEAESLKQFKCPDCVRRSKEIQEEDKRARRKKKERRERKEQRTTSSSSSSGKHDDHKQHHQADRTHEPARSRDEPISPLPTTSAAVRDERKEDDAPHPADLSTAHADAGERKEEDVVSPAAERDKGRERARKERELEKKRLERNERVKLKRKREREERRERDKEREREKKRDRKAEQRATDSSKAGTNGLPRKKDRGDDDDASRKRRRTEKAEERAERDKDKDRERERRRERARVSDDEKAPSPALLYKWLESVERDSSSEDEDVFVTSDDDCDDDDADLDAVLIDSEEPSELSLWRRHVKPRMEDDDEPALDALSLKQPSSPALHLIPFGDISLHHRTLLTTTQPPAVVAAGEEVAGEGATVDDLDHLRLHALHEAKMKVECELLELEQHRRIYLAGIDYAARMSVMRTMEAFDRRAEESVLLEDVDVDEEEEKEKERERERQREGEGSPHGAEHNAGMSSPRVVFPYTPRMPSLSRRQSTSTFASLSAALLDASSPSPPLFATSLTCSGCDGIVPIATYATHLLQCSLAAPEAGQVDWVNEAMVYMSGQWEAGRPHGGGDSRVKVRGDGLSDSRRKERTANGGDSRTSEKERERLRERNVHLERLHQRARPTPVGTSTMRIQGLLPLPALLHPSPTVPIIRHLRPRLPPSTRHSHDRDRERQAEREEERRREERRRSTKHDRHSLALNSVSGRFALQLNHLVTVCGCPMEVGQRRVYCDRLRADCIEHLMWEEVEKVRVEKRYWELSRRLELLKGELEGVQGRVNERVMGEAELIGSVLGDRILIENEDDEGEKEEREREERIVQRRKEEEAKDRLRRQGHLDAIQAVASPSTPAIPLRSSSSSSPSDKPVAMDEEDEHDGFVMTNTVHDISPTPHSADLFHPSSAHAAAAASPPPAAASPAALQYPYLAPTVMHQPGWVATPHGYVLVGADGGYYAQHDPAAVAASSAYGFASPSSAAAAAAASNAMAAHHLPLHMHAAALPPPPPTHPHPLHPPAVQPLHIHTNLGSPSTQTQSSLTTAAQTAQSHPSPASAAASTTSSSAPLSSSSSSSAFSPPARSGQTTQPRLSPADFSPVGSPPAPKGTSPPAQVTSPSAPAPAASTTVPLSAAEVSAVPPALSPPTPTASLPPPTPALPSQVNLSINANPTIPSFLSLAPPALVPSQHSPPSSLGQSHHAMPPSPIKNGITGGGALYKGGGGEGLAGSMRGPPPVAVESKM